MASGKIVHFDFNRGFGFVSPDGGGDDVFVHVNDVTVEEDLLRPGAEVSFDLEDSERGPRAVNLAVTGEGDAGFTKPVRRGATAPAAAPRRAAGSGNANVQGFLDEVTESLLDADATLTAGQILAVRQAVVNLAYGHGWLAD